MRSVIISVILLFLTIVSIIINAVYMHNFSTQLLDITFSLPSDYETMQNMSDEEREQYKSKINYLKKKWEENIFYLSMVVNYDEFEKTNSCIVYMKEYFFSGNYGLYLSERENFIHRIEKQKSNEVPNFENIF